MDAPQFGRRATPPPSPGLVPVSTDEHRFGRPLTQQEIDDAKRIAEERRKARDDRQRSDARSPTFGEDSPQDSILDALFQPRDPSANGQEPGLFGRLFGGGDGADRNGDGSSDGGGGGD